MAFYFVALIIISGLLTGSNSVELSRKHLTDGERLAFQEGHVSEQEWINFQSSLRRQAFLNSESQKISNNSARYGVNQFSYLSQQQFKERYLTTRANIAPKFDPFTCMNGIQVKTTFPPSRFDWRDHGVVGPVLYQGDICRGCWAISVVEAIESASAKKGGKLQRLSAQQVIDCSYENEGCEGGYTDVALHWLNETKLKLVKEGEYPYKAVDGQCKYFPISHDGVQVKDFAYCDFSNVEKKMIGFLLEVGPLVVSVNSNSWQDYINGIIQHHCSSHSANHAVVITGYDTTGDVPYWIVRNSWGSWWGNDGYVYIKMGDNMCGIAEHVAAVIV